VFQPIEKKLIIYMRNLEGIIEKFQSDGNKMALQMARVLLRQIETFKDDSWIIQYLTVEALVKKPSQWQELFEKCEKSLDQDMILNLNNLCKIGMLDMQSQIEEFSKRIEKQYALEKKFLEILDNLKEINIVTVQYKNTFILTQVDDIIQVLDDNINSLVFMKSSPFIKPIIKRCNDLEQKLILIEDTLEQGMRCQRFWKYLEPIFNSDDIKRKMPIESMKFVAVDRNFRNNMQSFHTYPQMWEAIENDKMKNDFLFNNKQLDIIQKSITEYLETKRMVFPRFFFLSDDQMLEILAQTKDPQMVQKHIAKCFEVLV